MYCNTVTLDGYEVFSDFNGYLKWIYLVDDNCGLIVSTFWVATAWFWVATEWAGWTSFDLIMFPRPFTTVSAHFHFAERWIGPIPFMEG